jgi:hypothetical protein
MRKSTIYLIAMVATFLSLIFFYVSYTYEHEAVHQAIYSSYGISSYVEYHWFSTVSGDTYASYNRSQCPEMCEFAHNMNEIIGYNISTIFATVIFFIFISYSVKFLFALREEDRIIKERLKNAQPQI